MYHKTSFIMYLWGDPYLRNMLLMFAGAVAFEILTLCIMVSTNISMASEIEDLELEEAPRQRYAFSRQGEVEVYDDFAVILREGTRVSRPMSEIWSVEWSGSREDRVLHIKHMSDDGPVTDAVHCGPMDVFEAMKVRDMLLHYMGG